jgi:hypothetical protein
MIHVARESDQPHWGEPGCCPMCGMEVRPRKGEVFGVGCWDGRSPDGRRTGGPIVAVNCAECGAALRTFHCGAWEDGDAANTSWQSDGSHRLVGGDWRHGRPGAWSPEDAPRHEARLRQLWGRLGSLEEAIRTLQAISGLGALPLAGLVERVAGPPIEKAKRLVVRALAGEPETQ